MRRVASLRSLRSLLVLNVLMTVAIGWAVVADRPGAMETAQAGEVENGIPNAGAQRLEMIRELRRLNLSMTDLRRDLANREFNVAVKSMPAVQVKSK